MSSLDTHSQLASIIERFAKGALVEMTKIIDKDSALLRAEIARRQMEVEALLCKLQFAESELRSARQAAAARQSAPNRRSVAVQVTISTTLQGKMDQVNFNPSWGSSGTLGGQGDAWDYRSGINIIIILRTLRKSVLSNVFVGFPFDFG